MDAIVVWDSWIALVDTSYHGQALVRHVRTAKTKLWMYLLQVMFGLLRRGNLKMLSWIVAPGSASVHVDSCRRRCQMRRHLRRCAIALKREELGKACALRLDLEARKGRDHGAGWLHSGRHLHRGPELHEEPRPYA